MLAVEVLLVVGLVVAVAVVAVGRAGRMSEETPLRTSTGLPTDRPLQAADVAGLRFPLTVRGYRMGDVDEALAAAAASLAALEDELVRLRGDEVEESGRSPEATPEGLPEATPEGLPEATPEDAGPQPSPSQVGEPAIGRPAIDAPANGGPADEPHTDRPVDEAGAPPTGTSVSRLRGQ